MVLFYRMCEGREAWNKNNETFHKNCINLSGGEFRLKVCVHSKTNIFWRKYRWEKHAISIYRNRVFFSDERTDRSVRRRMNINNQKRRKNHRQICNRKQVLQCLYPQKSIETVLQIYDSRWFISKIDLKHNCGIKYLNFVIDTGSNRCIRANLSVCYRHMLRMGTVIL